MEKTFKVISDNGLHARPATELVNAVTSFRSDLTIESKGRQANLKSIMGVMSLGIYSGDVIKITAVGEDQEKAMNKIMEVISNIKLAKEI